MSRSKSPSEAEQARLVTSLREELGDAIGATLEAHGEEGLTPVNLRRWLVARKWVYADALRDLRAHAQWRAEFCPHGRVLESEVPNELGEQKLFLQGTDRHGRGFVILDASRHTGSHPNENARIFVYTMDALIASADLEVNPQGRVAGLLDLSGFGIRNVDYRGLKNVFATLQAHYVERLGVMYMYNAPVIFFSLWRLVAPFVDPVTRAKVRFVYARDLDDLVEEVGPQVLPPHLGGTADPVPVEAASAALRAKQGRPQ